MHVMCSAHDYITDARNHKYINSLINAILQNNISVMAMNATEKYCLH